MTCSAYCRLMRLNKPIGIFLLWYPTAWALWVANQGMPSFKLLFLFVIGTLLMRSCGCVINDIADRQIDKHVERTKLRPLTTEEVSLKEALIIILLLLIGALIVLLNLPRECLPWAMASLLITLVYPLCKRYIPTPQLVLGFAFSIGIPIAFIASNAPMGKTTLILLFINFLWVVAYDTMYAMADKEDDLKIGVHSTAIYFGRYDRIIIGLLQCTLHLSWFFLLLYLPLGNIFYCAWILAGLILVYQQHLLAKRQAKDCFDAFLISSYYGLVMWAALL